MKFFSNNRFKYKKGNERGFTLLEMIVATSVFIFVMLMIIGSLISLTDASRKARSVRIVLDNLSSAIDSMSRNMRMGSYYHCGCETSPLAYASPLSCPMTDDEGNGGTSCFAFESANGNPHDPNDQVVYQLTGTTIDRSTDGGQSFVALTSPEISVSSLRFFVYGTTLNTDQPMVTFLLRGKAAVTKKTTSEFNIQTTIAARTPNFTAP